MTRLVMCSFLYYNLFKPYYFQSGTGTVTHFYHTTDGQESAGILFLPHYGLPARHWYRHRIESAEDRLDKCSWTSLLVMIISIVVTMNCINLFFVSLCKSSLVRECRFYIFILPLICQKLILCDLLIMKQWNLVYQWAQYLCLLHIVLYKLVGPAQCHLSSIYLYRMW